MMNVLQTVFEVYYLRNKQIQAKLPGNTDSDPFQLLVECGSLLASLGLQLVVLCHLHQNTGRHNHTCIIIIYMYSVYMLYIYMYMGVLCCFALFVCPCLLLSVFSSLIKNMLYTCIYTCF